MEDLVEGAPQPDDPRERKPLSRKAKLALGLLALIIGAGGVLWTAATSFPDIHEELIANTILRCTASAQCVPNGGGACWNKTSVAIRAVLHVESPIDAINPGGASSCLCSEGMCGVQTKTRINTRGYVPPPQKSP